MGESLPTACQDSALGAGGLVCREESSHPNLSGMAPAVNALAANVQTELQELAKAYEAEISKCMMEVAEADREQQESEAELRRVETKLRELRASRVVLNTVCMDSR